MIKTDIPNLLVWLRHVGRQEPNVGLAADVIEQLINERKIIAKNIGCGTENLVERSEKIRQALMQLDDLYKKGFR